ncbi:hypothetical protein PFICI_14663 [Pestalotiopsis fici W106-1]|uniref:Heterokaryon incompatibility domain-containing protein n=1 Tax=Pestalotiopsis fici (strain W106-1 / CGMCC3.15140) TaxID=1229662 RepID=W3WKP3_PESFW|nr:uncharacterized protein PFICI_14663 [Pestalotiopsis fici W106-1]ETS73717.1 hypothetical protein PFICI_14663 [Pestalotiopsis fici W106-1]
MYPYNYSQNASEYHTSTLYNEHSQSTPTSPDQLYDSISLPVGAGMIRLLYLDPFPSPTTTPEEMESRPLQGTLVKIKLIDSPRFAALSYCWGEMKLRGNETIQCGTASIDITPNCAKALRAIRRHQFATSSPPLPIWVDALCINQAETPTAKAEKADQLPLMGEIYQWADPVYIWLGSGDSSIHAGFATLQQFFPACRFRRSTQSLPWILEMRRSERWRKRARYIWDNAFLQGAVCYRLMLALKRRKIARYIWDNSLHQGSMLYRLVMGFMGLTSSELSWPPPQDSGEIQKLLECEWFTRGWTFQEAVLAINPTILYDDMTLSWIDFLSALEIGFPKLFVDSPAHSLGTAWMNIRRPLHWNGLQRRPRPSYHDHDRALPRSDLTFRHYLETCGHECSRDITSPPENHDDTSFCHTDNLLSWLHLVHFSGEMLAWAILFMPLYLLILQTNPAVITQFIPWWLFGLFSLTYAVFAMFVFQGFNTLPQRTSRGIQNLCFMPLIAGSNAKEERMALIGNATVATGMSRNSAALIEPFERSSDVLLQALMRAVSERHTSNSHDGVYAYFGVLKANGFDIPDVKYSQSPAEVHRDFLKSLLDSDQSLIGLIVEAGTRRGEGFAAPSWVCHWGGGKDQPRCPITPKYIYNTAESKATPNSRPYADVSKDGCKLTVHGFLSDHIAYCSPRLVDFLESDVVEGVDVRSAAGKAILAFSDWFMHATRDLAVNYKYQPLPGTIFEILHGRFEDGTHNRPIVHQNRGFDAWYGIVTRSIGNMPAEEMKLPKRRADLLQLIVAGLVKDQGAKKYLVELVNRLASKRRLIFTKNQDLAIGYGEVHKGDIISLVAGVAIPLIVRETGEDRYTLVGPAIVPTWMGGEEWKRLSGRNVDVSTKRIVLV